jgi:hypothetical protein
MQNGCTKKSKRLIIWNGGSIYLSFMHACILVRHDGTCYLKVYVTEDFGNLDDVDFDNLDGVDFKGYFSFS